MSPKVFLGWLVATAVTVVAAIFAVAAQPELATVRLVNEPAFPALREDPDAVARIVVADKDGSFTVERKDGQWVAAERFGYPVASAKVRDLVVSLADMRLVESKTARPELFPRLEVEDIAAPEAKSRLVRLETAEGAVLAEAIVGKRRPQMTGRQSAGTYLRRPGEQQAWLASGGVKVEPQLNEWLAKEIVDVASDSVRRIEIVPAEGEAYALVKAEQGGELTLESLPEGRTQKEGAASRLGGALSSLELQDVMPAAERALPESSDRAVVTTFDGVRVTAQLAEIDGETWATFEAAYAGDAAADDDSEAAKAARDNVADINRRVGGWVYRLADYSGSRLTTPLSELLEPRDGTS